MPFRDRAVCADAPTRATRVFDETNTYVLTQTYDYGSRPRWTTLPSDPDWDDEGGLNPVPVVKADHLYNKRGLLFRVRARIDGTDYWVRYTTAFNASRLPTRINLGDDHAGTRARTRQWFTYDSRLRLTRTYARRDSTGGTLPDLSAVTYPIDQTYTWDAASNLAQVSDGRLKSEWSDGYRPQRASIGHDALYRVATVDYDYKDASGSWTTVDPATDWRNDRAFHEADDPMREQPAAMLPTLPDNRVVSLTYEYDWLANMVSWTDDASSFYERSLDRISNGFEEGQRPSALYLASNITTTAPGSADPGIDRGGYVELDYGEGGNVVAMTVHAQCHDPDASAVCYDQSTQPLSVRRSNLRSDCTCDAEQHYQYRWDELDRIAEARRYDRAGAGSWTLAVRQRYRYDDANVRTVKETFGDGVGPRADLHVMPGNFERAGVERDLVNSAYIASAAVNTETQYHVGDGRIVWKHDAPATYDLERDLRITVPLADVLGSTTAVMDVWSGELLEVSTWYPNGAQETLRTQNNVAMQQEPRGFTGKEADSEVGLAYFGERYLIPRIGRWASPDPLHVHAAGGGEALNSYHYVNGNLLQGHDPLGLVCGVDESCPGEAASEPGGQANISLPNGEVASTSPPGANMTSPSGRPVQAPTTPASRPSATNQGATISARQGSSRPATPSPQDARVMRDRQYESGAMQAHQSDGIAQSGLNFAAGVANDVYHLAVPIPAPDLVSTLEDVGVDTGVDRYSIEYGAFTDGPNLQSALFAAVGGARSAEMEGASGGGGGGRTLYRAVGPDELADIQAAGRYRVPEGGTEGKYFFETPEQASNFARMMGDQPYTTTSVRVSPAELGRGQRITPAREGPAYFFDTPDVPSGSVNVHNYSVVP